MAEIDLQRKRGGKWWHWFLGALVAILVIWGIAELLEQDQPYAGDPDVVEETDPGAVGPAPAAEMTGLGEEAAAALDDFRRTCVDDPEADETPNVGVQHEYASTCLEQMAAAFEATIQTDTVGSVVLEQRLNRLRENAREVRQSDPAATTHAGTVGDALRAGADLVETLREERFPEDDQLADHSEQAREHAESIRADQPLLEQDQDVRSYFREIADALEGIA